MSHIWPRIWQRTHRAGFMHVVACVFVVMCGAGSPLAAQQQPPAAGVQQPRSAAEDTRRGIVDGSAAADSASTRAWKLGGAFSWMVMGLGQLVVPALAADSGVSVPTVNRLRIVDESTAYQTSFETAYVLKLKTRREQASRRGVVVGGVVLGVVAVAVLLIELPQMSEIEIPTYTSGMGLLPP